MLSQTFLQKLESSRKIKNNTPINEDGFSPFLFSVNISPSNRIQIKINPHFESRGKSAKSDDSELIRLSHPLNLPCPLSPHAEGGGYLASLPNCTARLAVPFSPELEFQNWVESFNVPPDELDKSPHPDVPKAKQFTSLARRTILDAAGALEKEGYLPHQFQFFTGTLPGSSPAACEYFARYSRPFLDSMKKVLRRLSLDLTFNCWEWQLRKKGNLVPALHLHMVVICVDEQLAARLPQILEDTWFRLLIHYSSKSGVDFFEKHDKLGGGRWTRELLKKAEQKHGFQTCKTVACTKSVGAYLSKYVGKGSLAGDTDFQARFKKGKVPLYYPSSWWSISNSIRDLIKKHSASYSFKNNINLCMDAYHSLISILEDEDFDLIELALPVFIPEWSCGNRLYQNFYCKSDKYLQCSELVASYSDKSDNYYSSQSIYIPQTAACLQTKFEHPDYLHLKSRLLRVLPFYCVTDGVIDWDNPLVIEKAFSVTSCEVDFPTPESLSDRIRWQKYLDNLPQVDKDARDNIRLSMYI